MKTIILIFIIFYSFPAILTYGFLLAWAEYRINELMMEEGEKDWENIKPIRISLVISSFGIFGLMALVFLMITDRIEYKGFVLRSKSKNGKILDGNHKNNNT